MPDTDGMVQIAVLVRTAKLQGPLTGGLLAEIIDVDDHILDSSNKQWLAMPGHAWRSDSYAFPMNKLSPFQEHLNANDLCTEDGGRTFEDTHKLVFYNKLTGNSMENQSMWVSLNVAFHAIFFCEKFGQGRFKAGLNQRTSEF